MSNSDFLLKNDKSHDKSDKKIHLFLLMQEKFCEK
jgi:hypothetical protein